MAARNRDPRTKEELLDRMLSYDFDGDIRHLGAEPARIVRTAANRLELTFPDTGRTYELQVRIPREDEEQPAPRRSARQEGERSDERRSFSRQEGEEEWTAPPAEPERRTRARQPSRRRPGEATR